MVDDVISGLTGAHSSVHKEGGGRGGKGGQRGRAADLPRDFLKSSVTHRELEELDVTPLGLSGRGHADCELSLPVRQQTRTLFCLAL